MLRCFTSFTARENQTCLWWDSVNKREVTITQSGSQRSNEANSEVVSSGFQDGFLEELLQNRTVQENLSSLICTPNTYTLSLSLKMALCQIWPKTTPWWHKHHTSGYAWQPLFWRGYRTAVPNLVRVRAPLSGTQRDFMGSVKSLNAYAKFCLQAHLSGESTLGQSKILRLWTKDS